MKTASLFGHAFIRKVKQVRARLLAFVESLIIEQKVERFLIGNHGEFDSLALSVCKQLREKYQFEICLVFSTLSILKEKKDVAESLYGDITTMCYEIENVYFKNVITFTNQSMIDESDIVVFYVDEEDRRSRSKRFLNYAKKKNKVLYNLYRPEDDPFYGMTKEEIEIGRKKFFSKKHD